MLVLSLHTERQRKTESNCSVKIFDTTTKTRHLICVSRLHLLPTWPDSIAAQGGP